MASKSISTTSSSSSSSAVSSVRKKRSHKPLTLNTKLQMIRLSEQGMSKAEIGRKLGVPRPTVSTVVNTKEKVLNEVISATPLNTTLIRKRDGLIADMEKLLLSWIEEQTSLNIPVSQAAIQDKALSLFSSLKVERGQAAAGDTFNASRGWFSRFKKRCNLQNTNLQDEASGTSTYTVNTESYPNEFLMIMQDCGYTSQQIFRNSTHGHKKPSRTYNAKEKSLPDTETVKNIQSFTHMDRLEDFKNSMEENNANVTEMAGEFAVKVEPEDEDDIPVSHDDLMQQQKQILHDDDEESLPDEHPDIHREITITELEKAVSYIKTGMAAFERLDPNFERSSEVNFSLLKGISCYLDMLREKTQLTRYRSLISNCNKLSADRPSTLTNLETTKETSTRTLTKSSLSKRKRKL